MHKYRSVARRAAWYDDPEAEDVQPYNPFKKIRVRSAPAYSDAETSPPEGLVRVRSEGYLKDKAAEKSSAVDIIRTTTTPLAQPPQNKKIDEKVDEPDLEHGLVLLLDKTPLREERAKVQADLSRLQKHSFAHKIRRFLWRKDTDILNEGLSSTGLIISGTVFLAKPHPVSSRRRAFVTSLRLIDGIPCTASSTGDLVESRSKGSTTVRIKRELSKPSGLAGLKIVYVQNDEVVMSNLTEEFCRDLPYNITKVSTSSKRFRDWMVRAPGLHGASKKQCFWKIPEADTPHMFRLAFGMGLLRSRVCLLRTFRSCQRRPRRSHTKSGEQKRIVISPRLTVYVQLPAPKTQSYSTYTRKSTIFIHQTLSENVVLPGLWLQDSSWPQNLASQAAQIKSTDPSIISLFLTREILVHVFEGVLESWNEHFNSIYERLEAIEEIVYAKPSDDRQAPEIWAVYKHVLEVQQLLGLHTSLLEEVQVNIEAAVKALEKSCNDTNIKEIFGPDSFGHMIRDYKDMSKLVPDDLLKPLDHMIDLVYKSVSIRDAKQSLEVNLSLFRLSWITFIFLPLTFLAGVFGKNVTILEHLSIKWYFVVAVPLMILILASWLFFRIAMSKAKPFNKSLNPGFRPKM